MGRNSGGGGGGGAGGLSRDVGAMREGGKYGFVSRSGDSYVVSRRGDRVTVRHGQQRRTMPTSAFLATARGGSFNRFAGVMV